MKNSGLQDGLIAEGMIVFGGPQRGGHAAKGYSLHVPQIANADPRYLMGLENGLRSLIRSIDRDSRLQVCWSTDGDHREVLLSYYERTEKLCREEWSRLTRDERFVRFHRRGEAGALRGDRLAFYLSRPFSERPSTSSLVIASRLSAMAQGFQAFEPCLSEFVSSIGGTFSTMDDQQLAYECAKYLNPYEVGPAQFDPEQTILENFQRSEGVGIKQPLVGFYLGGAYHGILTLDSLPEATCSGLVQLLTGLPVQDFSVCINAFALDLSGEIAKAEDEISKLRRTLTHSDHARMESAVAMKRERVSRLMGGAVAPFLAQVIIRAWARSPEELQIKLASIKSMILRMRSAKPGEAAFPSSALNLFRCCCPGWSWDPYPDYRHYIEDHNLSNLLPVTGTSGSDLEHAEALYDTPVGGLLGFRGFAGEPGSEAPQHMIVTGATGSGKSLWVNDLLAQTDPHYDFTVIVDDGLSYGGYVAARGGRSFIVDPDGGITFNYLDPCGALLPQHLTDVCAVVGQMCGLSAESADGIRMRGLLSSAVDRFYRDMSSDWIKGSGDRLDNVCREALLFQEWTGRSAADGAWADAWSEYCHRKADHNLKSVDIASQFSHSEVEVFKATESASEATYRLSFAHMTRVEVPTHAMFRDWLEVESLSGGSESADLEFIARQLGKWCAVGGSFGPIVDGPGNVDFRGSLIHLELGRIPESAPELKKLAMLIVCNFIRNAITARPRSQRKRVVLEEASSLLNIPSTEIIVRDLFERSRKYGVLMIAILQTLRDRADSPALISMIANATQVAFFKQSSADEARFLAGVFRLPDCARELVLGLRSPTKERGAAFVLCNNRGHRVQVSVGCNLVSPEMLAMSGSSGDQYEARSSKRA